MVLVFDSNVATQYGLREAILFQSICYWVFRNKANDVAYYDGRYWTFNSVSAWSEMYPFLTEKQIRTTLDSLVSQGLIAKGNYNKNPFDKTAWYCLTDLGESICLQSEPRFALEGKPIPSNNCNEININISNKEKEILKKEKGFNPPSLEEVKAYIKEKGYRFNPNDFFDYYASANWHKGDGKPVRNWKQCCATWESHAHGNAASVTRRPIIDISDPNTYANGRDEKERLNNWD